MCPPTKRRLPRHKGSRRGPRVLLQLGAVRHAAPEALPHRPHTPMRRREAQLLPRWLSAALLLLLALAAHAAAGEPDAAPSKVGAGLLLCCEGKVLLLRRSSKHHDDTWGLPGGNQEGGDSSLLATATREAMEELGAVPPFDVRAQLLTRRGKRLQKHFTVFAAEVPPAVPRDFRPQLSAEHSAAQWVRWADVVAAARAGSGEGQDEGEDEGGEEGGNDEGAGSGAAATLQLHPVVRRLVAQHREALASVLQSCAG